VQSNIAAGKRRTDCQQTNLIKFCRQMPNTHRRRDETVLSRRRRRCEHYYLQLDHDDCRRIRSTVWKLTKQTPYRLITPILIDIDNFFNNDVIMSSLLKKLSISIKIHVVKQLWSRFGQFQNCRPNPSWASCELCSHRRRRRDKTVSSRRRRRCVLDKSLQNKNAAVRAVSQQAKRRNGDEGRMTCF